ncbi:GWxTD domain-containing protein [candidate division KSB1 bacterium]|nr:GWxTD domain-containing protein [candidate division KSB1 bacterium]
MVSFKRLLFFALFLCLARSAATLEQQPGLKGGGEHDNLFGQNLFSFQTFLFADPDSSNQTRVIFFFSLVNDLLTFIKQSDSSFEAHYEISVVIYNLQKQALAERSVRRRVATASFAATNSRLMPLREKLMISLPAGDYLAHLRLIDREAGQILQREKKLQIRAFDRTRLQFSDLVFADSVDCTSNNALQSLAPNSRDVYDRQESAFRAFMRIYPPLEAVDSLVIQAKVYDPEGRQVFEQIQIFREWPEQGADYCLDFKENLRTPGQHTLRIAGAAGGLSARIQRQFRVFWGDLDLKEMNADVLIDQLKLIAPKELIRRLREADDEKRAELIEEFWKNRDPNPHTQANELEEEFYRRIDFANRNFSEIVTNRQGWETDRGRIYITNGPPTEVEKQPATIDRPSAEIWFYASLNKRYIFSDRNGSGHYRLVKVE